MNAKKWNRATVRRLAVLGALCVAVGVTGTACGPNLQQKSYAATENGLVTAPFQLVV